MSSTDSESAARFFADLLLPLHHANARRGIAYLDRGPKRASYWGEVASRTGGMERLSSTSDAAAMLSVLGGYWQRRNETDLLQLLPYLQKLQQELTGATPREDSTDTPLQEFVYPLF
jgi:hypothetical protein